MPHRHCFYITLEQPTRQTRHNSARILTLPLVLAHTDAHMTYVPPMKHTTNTIQERIE